MYPCNETSFIMTVSCLMCFWVWLVRISLRSFKFVFISKVGLCFLSGCIFIQLGFKVISALFNNLRNITVISSLMFWFHLSMNLSQHFLCWIFCYCFYLWNFCGLTKFFTAYWLSLVGIHCIFSFLTMMSIYALVISTIKFPHHHHLLSPEAPQHIPLLPPSLPLLQHTGSDNYCLLGYWLDLLAWSCIGSHNSSEFMSSRTMSCTEYHISQHFFCLIVLLLNSFYLLFHDVHK